MSSRRRDLAILTFLLAVVATSIAYIARLKPDEKPTIEQVLPPAELTALERLRTRYGDAGDLVVVLLRAKMSLATPSGRLPGARIAELEGELRELPGVRRTWSALSRPRLEYDGSTISIVTGGDERSDVQGALDRFLSPAADSAILLVELAPAAATLSGARAFTTALEACLERERGRGDDAFAVGGPILRVATWDAASRDATRMLPALVLVVVVVPLLFFRSLWAAVFPFVVAALSSGATLALNRIVTGGSSPWMLVLLPLVWSVATMDAMHFYETTRRHGRVDSLTVRAARRELLLPCLLTAVTTAVSLAVLAAPGGPALFRAVGAWGALGTMLAYGFTFLLGGPLLRIVPERSPLPEWPKALARRLVVWSARHSWRIVSAWFAMVVAAALAIPRLHVESRYPRVFADGAGGVFEDDLRELPRLLDADLLPLEIHLEARTERARRREAVVLATLGLHDYLATLPDTRLSLSAATLLSEWIATDARATVVLARASRAGVGGFAADDSQRATDLLTDPRVAHWLRADLGASRTEVLFRRTSYARKEELIRFIAHYVATVYPDYDVRFAGPLFVYHVAEREGISGIFQGAALDLVLILATFALIFRRVRATASAVIVNVAPVLILIGVMAAARVPWSLGLLGLPVIVLGLAVDDTVHLLWEARTATRPTALGVLLVSTRRSAAAVLSTCALLAGCLASLARSGFQVNHELGVLLPLGLLLALCAELTLLPALLRIRPISSAQRK